MKPLFQQTGLPVFEFLIDDSQESGVKCVSIVSDPAFGVGAIRFDKDAPKPKYIALGDKKQQIIAGFIILANVPVYRTMVCFVRKAYQHPFHRSWQFLPFSFSAFRIVH